jgi:predicted nucleic acid-binding protein
MTSVYLDACIVIHLVEGDEEQQKMIKSALRGKTVFSSELVRLEARIKAIRENQQPFLNTYDQFFKHCRTLSLDKTVFEKATDLRVNYRLKTPDALHLAAALNSDCEQFWTNDYRLAKAASENSKTLKIVLLSDLENLFGGQ